MKTRNFTIVALVLTIALGFSSDSVAAIITSYDFDGGSNPDLNPDTVDADISASVISAGANNIPASQATYASQVLRTNHSTTASSESVAVSSGAFFEFSVTLTNLEKSLNLTNLTFDAARGGGGTPRSWYVYSSIDGFTLGNAIDSADVPTARPTLTPFVVDLSDAKFQGLTGTTIFRVYNSTPSTSSSLEWDNFVLNGEAVLPPVPEPSSLMLLGLGAIGLVRHTRRRRCRA